MTTEAMPRITDRRTIGNRQMCWTVNEFDGGERYMLICQAPAAAMTFDAHFTAEEWRDFQGLVKP